MLDSGAGDSCVCTDLLTKLNLKPTGIEVKPIKQLQGRFTKNADIYKLQVSSGLFDDFTITLECINMEKDILIYMSNRKISDIRRRYGRLKRLQFFDLDDESEMQPMHIIMGAADHQRINKTESKKQRIKKTKLSWKKILTKTQG